MKANNMPDDSKQVDPAIYTREALRNFRHQPEIYLMTLMNFIPVYGVFFLGWEPLQAFGIYVLETIIIGLFHVVKMLVILRFGQGDPSAGKSGLVGYILIPFFLLHYNFFIFVQLIFYTVIAAFSRGTPSDTGPGAIPELLLYILGSDGGVWVLLGITISHFFSFIIDFIMRDGYKRYTASQMFFQPYKRIIIQQFVILLGSFISIIMFGGGAIVFVILFCTIKAAIDVVLYLHPLNRLPSSEIGNQAGTI